MRILVVEDDLGIVRMLQAILADEGHQVSTTRGQDSFLPLVRREQPQAIILDIQLGRTSGEELLDALADEANLRATPVIVSSAWREPMRRAYQAAREREQPVRLLPKPYGLDDLLAAVDWAASQAPGS